MEACHNDVDENLQLILQRKSISCFFDQKETGSVWINSLYLFKFLHVSVYIGVLKLLFVKKKVLRKTLRNEALISITDILNHKFLETKKIKIISIVKYS